MFQNLVKQRSSTIWSDSRTQLYRKRSPITDDMLSSYVSALPLSTGAMFLNVIGISFFIPHNLVYVSNNLFKIPLIRICI